jgi:hypothetical protein
MTIAQEVIDLIKTDPGIIEQIGMYKFAERITGVY